MNDTLDNMKTMQRDPTYDTIGDMLTQRPEEAIVLAGRYRIVRKLGEGGMGSVWLAEDTKLDGRQVAIKMLPVVLVANKRAIQQLKAEAKVAIQLAHPNIATLRGFEEAEEGPFLVMDYIEGQTLEDILAERGALPEDEVIRLFTPIAQALDYAHAQRVVHRDIKPSNILIREDGAPFITDFGIAREMKDTMTRVTGRSTSGTLPYMSPEQLRGDAPTTQQDIYSLAATMYECLAGHPPFYRGAIEHQILIESPPSLPSTSVISRSILSALAKDPTTRPSSVLAIFPKPSKPFSHAISSVAYSKQLVSVSMKDMEAVFSQCALDADEKWLLGCRTGGGLSYEWLIVYNNTRIYVIVTTKRLLFVSRSWWRSAEVHLQVPHSAIARYHVRKDGVSIWMPDGKHYKVAVESRYKKTLSELRMLLPQLAQCTME